VWIPSLVITVHANVPYTDYSFTFLR